MKLFLSVIFSFALILGTGFALQAHAQVAGCATTAGYNPTTGMACNGASVIPPGCTSPAGFSATTGTPCNGNTAAANGFNGGVMGANGFINGCTSTTGYSSTTGTPCNTVINGTGTGTVTTTTPPVMTTSPGLPTTGAGSTALPTVLVLIASGLVSFAGIRYGVQQYSNSR